MKINALNDLHGAKLKLTSSLDRLESHGPQDSARAFSQCATRWNSVEKVCMRRAPAGVISMVSANTQPVLP